MVIYGLTLFLRVGGKVDEFESVSGIIVPLGVDEIDPTFPYIKEEVTDLLEKFGVEFCESRAVGIDGRPVGDREFSEHLPVGVTDSGYIEIPNVPMVSFSGKRES